MPHFDDSESGINDDDVDLVNNCSESSWFQYLFENHLAAHISIETYFYCKQYVDRTDIKDKPKVSKWYNTVSL